ncbi:hypothetical protein STEG23_020672, partial [Scotinomys teguina]
MKSQCARSILSVSTEMAYNYARNSASPPHLSPLERRASVSKPRKQAILQAEGSPEPLNKTSSQPFTESMETNTTDVKVDTMICLRVQTRQQRGEMPARHEEEKIQEIRSVEDKEFMIPQTGSYPSKNSGSVQCLVVDLHICYHQSLEKNSMMTVRAFTGLISGASQLSSGRGKLPIGINKTNHIKM